MPRIARAASIAVFIAAFAALPATAGAAGHGNHCGKGHAKHSHALGKSCQKAHGHANRRDELAPVAPITVPAAVVKACQDEQAADAAAFQAKYANAAGREALGRCVRLNAGSTASGDSPTAPSTPAPTQKHDGDGTAANAAQACAAEKSADAAAFQAKYADADGREAFGHCVHRWIQANPPASSDDNAGTSDQSAQGDQTDQGDQGGDGADQTDATDGGDTSAGGDDTSGLDSLFF